MRSTLNYPYLNTFRKKKISVANMQACICWSVLLKPLQAETDVQKASPLHLPPAAAQHNRNVYHVNRKRVAQAIQARQKQASIMLLMARNGTAKTPNVSNHITQRKQQVQRPSFSFSKKKKVSSLGPFQWRQLPFPLLPPQHHAKQCLWCHLIINNLLLRVHVVC